MVFWESTVAFYFICKTGPTARNYGYFALKFDTFVMEAIHVAYLLNNTKGDPIVF